MGLLNGLFGKRIPSFDQGYSQFCSSKGVSAELRPLVKDVYEILHREPVVLENLKASLIRLLTFLCQPGYRTDENCRAVDRFFCIEDHWGKRWENQPEAYQRVLEDVGFGLHDTVSSPEIAKGQGTTPEQLLVRAKEL